MTQCGDKRQATSDKRVRSPHVACRMSHGATSGFTLIEIMLGTSIMVIVLTALLGSFFGQSTLNQNSRNMMAAMNDATRVMEEIRRQNARNLDGSFPAWSLCATANIPSARPPPLTGGLRCPAGGVQCESWNEWLDASGKSLVGSGSLEGSNDAYEIVAVTCQDADGGTAQSDYCGWTASGQGRQVGLREWYPWWSSGNPPRTNNVSFPVQGGIPTGLDPRFDPIRVTVAVGWAQKRQEIG